MGGVASRRLRSGYDAVFDARGLRNAARPSEDPGRMRVERLVIPAHGGSRPSWGRRDWDADALRDIVRNCVIGDDHAVVID